MVAAGGGGDASHTSPSNTMYSCNVNNSKVLGKYGGTLNGIDNVDFGILGGKQDNGGICNFMEYCGIGSFGKGGDAIKNSHANGGGGGGYYGGAADRSEYLQGTSGIIGGASGSCFISGYPGCNAISEDSTENNIIHTNQSKHYSGYVFNNSQMIAGNEEMPTHDGLSTMIGNGGNGYAKITYLGN